MPQLGNYKIGIAPNAPTLRVVSLCCCYLHSENDDT